jgi:hypothetical protein
MKKLRDRSSATFVEKFFLENEGKIILHSMFKVMPNLQFMNATFVENHSKPKNISNGT